MTVYEYRVQFVATIEGWRELAPHGRDQAALVETALNEDSPDFARHGWEVWNVVLAKERGGFMIIYRRPRQ